MKIKLELQNKTKTNFLNEKLLTKIAKQLFTIFGQQDANVSLTVFYVDKNEIQEINKNYRNIDSPTDVISFRLLENPKNLPLIQKNFPLEFDQKSKTIYLGEIFICDEVAKAQSKEFGNSHFRETLELFVHGLLHILGCDHHKKQETEYMKNFELQMIKFFDEQKLL